MSARKSQLLVVTPDPRLTTGATSNLYWPPAAWGPGFGLVIGFTSVPRSEVECCASNHIHVSSECHHTFPEIRELLRQMGSGLVVTKSVLINNTKINTTRDSHLTCGFGTNSDLEAHSHQTECFGMAPEWRMFLATSQCSPREFPSSSVVWVGVARVAV